MSKNRQFILAAAMAVFWASIAHSLFVLYVWFFPGELIIFEGKRDYFTTGLLFAAVGGLLTLPSTSILIEKISHTPHMVMALVSYVCFGTIAWATFHKLHSTHARIHLSGEEVFKIGVLPSITGVMMFVLGYLSPSSV